MAAFLWALIMGTSFTQQDLENIERAIATGELKVQRGDQMVQFRSMDELKKAYNTIKHALETQNNQPKKGSVTYAGFSQD